MTAARTCARRDPPRSRAISAIEDHDERHLEGGQQPHGRGRDPEQGHRCGREQRRQGRLVDVAEGRVLARHDVVHLVAVEAVGARQGQQPDEP